MKKYKISKLRKELLNLGLDISDENLRRYEKIGLIYCSRSKVGFREFTDEDIKRSIKNVLLYYFHTPVEVIKSKDESVVKEACDKIMSLTELLA